MNESINKKRKWEKLKSLSPDSGRPLYKTTNSSPRFFIIEKSGEGNFQKLSPFLISKSIKSELGEVISIKKLKEGSILVETKHEQQAEKLLRCKNLFNCEVNVKPHQYLNKCKGIIRCPDLDNCTLEEIRDEMRDQGVCEVSRMTYKRNNEIQLSDRYILTFSTPTLPETVSVGFYKVKTQLFVPSPLRCFRCFYFGHTAVRCRNTEVCGMCCEPPHKGACTKPVTCNLCKDSHPSWDRRCRVYKI